MSKVSAVETPVSQSVEAVMALIKSHGWSGDNPPASVKMSDSCVLVLSAREDQYYTVTRRACSCPSYKWRGGPCKHQRRYLGMVPDPARVTTIPAGGFRPVLEEAI